MALIKASQTERSDRRYIARDVEEAVNPTGSSKIPEGHRRFLLQLLAPDLNALKQRFELEWKQD